MARLWKFILTLGVSALLIAPAFAADEAKPKKAAKAAAKKKEQPTVQLPKDLTLTEEQKKKVEELEKEYAPKAKELREKLDKVLTEEQKKARAEVMKSARTDGKKGKELQQAIKDATKATGDQEKQIDELDKKIRELRVEILEKVKPLLTEEQKAKLPGRKPAAKKPKDAKAA